MMTLFAAEPLQQAYLTSGLDDTIASWLTLGIGPWFVARNMPTGPITYRETPTELTISVGLALCGHLQVELIQQSCRTPSIYTEFLEHASGGFHHLAWLSDDVDRSRSEARACGWTVAQHGRSPRAEFVYFEPPRPELPYFEVISRTEATEGLHAMLIEATRTWDGVTDPVRPWPSLATSDSR